MRADILLFFECAALGTFPANKFLPLLSSAFLESVDMLINLNKALAAYVEKIRAKAEKCFCYLYATLPLVAAFLPESGCQKRERILEESHRQGKRKNFLNFLKGKLDKAKVIKRLDFYSVMSLGYEG